MAGSGPFIVYNPNMTATTTWTTPVSEDVLAEFKVKLDNLQKDKNIDPLTSLTPEQRAARERALAEEKVPLRCFNCKSYDGTFGTKVDKENDAHQCKKCITLPENPTVSEEHLREYEDNRDSLGEELLNCNDCGLTPEDCTCMCEGCDNYRINCECSGNPYAYEDEGW